MYNRIARLLVKEEMLSRNILLDRVIILIHKLLLFRENVKIAIKKTQEKIKQDILYSKV